MERNFKFDELQLGKILNHFSLLILGSTTIIDEDLQPTPHSYL